MNSSLWSEWDFPGHLAKSYFPSLGSARITVTDAKSGAFVHDCVVTVVYGNGTHVTRKQTGSADPFDGGFVEFGGWVSKSQRSHTVTLAAPGYVGASAVVQLEAGQTLAKTFTLTKTLAKA